MSNAVFVQDAAGRPLMPTAPAYARTLVRAGKAAFVSHPALPILQLTHPVAAPVLHPVLVGIRLHDPLASLLVFTERTGLVVLLHLAVAFQPQVRGLTLVRAVRKTITTLMTLLPITHLIGSHPASPASEHQMALLGHALLPFGVRVPQQQDALAPDDSVRALSIACADVTRTTDIADASVLAYAWPPLPHKPPPMIVRVRDGTRTRTGLGDHPGHTNVHYGVTYLTPFSLNL
ncbi:MAG: hypothetical protein HC884_08130 [Chloroflexaceae bacterium]|nr:hypothetical protein [Chloroflexaceae bacterium]